MQLRRPASWHELTAVADLAIYRRPERMLINGSQSLSKSLKSSCVLRLDASIDAYVCAYHTRRNTKYAEICCAQRNDQGNGQTDSTKLS